MLQWNNPSYGCTYNILISSFTGSKSPCGAASVEGGGGEKKISMYLLSRL